MALQRQMQAHRGLSGMVLNGKTLGVWGYGRIGQLVASYARTFGMRVMVWGSESARERAEQRALKRQLPFHRQGIVRSTEEVFAAADAEVAEAFAAVQRAGVARRARGVRGERARRDVDAGREHVDRAAFATCAASAAAWRAARVVGLA